MFIKEFKCFMCDKIIKSTGSLWWKYWLEESKVIAIGTPAFLLDYFMQTRGHDFRLVSDKHDGEFHVCKDDFKYCIDKPIIGLSLIEAKVDALSKEDKNA